MDERYDIEPCGMGDSFWIDLLLLAFGLHYDINGRRINSISRRIIRNLFVSIFPAEKVFAYFRGWKTMTLFILHLADSL